MQVEQVVLPISGASPRTPAPACGCRGSIYADDDPDDGASARTPRSSRWRTPRPCPGSSRHRSRCRTSTRATASRSAASSPPTWPDGVVSPGGVGYDINCGVRLLATDLVAADVARAHGAAGRRARPRPIPSGVGSTGRVTLSGAEDAAGAGPGGRRGGRWRRGTATRTTSAGSSPTARLPGRRSRRGVGEGLRARAEPARHARLGQPLPRGAGRGDGVPARRRAARSGSRRAASR